MGKYFTKNMRILHFEKYLPCKEQQTGMNQGERQESQSDREERQFFSFGYYDELSYVRAKAPDMFDYRHCFLLKYPYLKSGRRIAADQVFILNDPEECVSSDDPFEYGGESLRPFLGIILVTVSGKSENTACGENMYGSLVTELERGCREFLNQMEKGHSCYKIFYTPNCADLCIVLRTDTIEWIYQLKQHITQQTVCVNEHAAGVFHAISHTLIEPGKEPWPSCMLERNQTVEIEMRLSASDAVMKRLQAYLEDEGKGKIYGITGAGQYALETDFATFAGLYPLLEKIKTDQSKSLKKCAEESEIKNDLQKCFMEEPIECSYMRVKYPMYTEDSSVEHYTGNPADIALIKKYEKQVSDLREPIKNSAPSLEYMVREKEVMLMELFNTYNDFWYRPSSWWKGMWFYGQLESVINGINGQKALIEEPIREQKIEEKLTIQLGSDITCAVASINNFNKLLQSINQYVINVPNYEIQTKVNVEKYLMAYTVHLLKICITYRKKMEREKRVLPVIALDLTQKDISARVLFCIHGNASRNKGPEDILFAIRIPNYQWLANIYHVLPMITHEISHNFRYMGRAERNKFVARYVLDRLSDYLLEELMAPTAGDGGAFYDGMRKFLRDNIGEVIQEEIAWDIYKKEWGNFKFYDIGSHIRDEFLKVTGIYNEDRELPKCWEQVTNDLIEIAKITSAEYFKYQDLSGLEITGKKCNLIWFNCILDIMEGEKENGSGKKRCAEWEKALEKKMESFTGNEVIRRVLEDNLKSLSAYEKTGRIPSIDLYTAIRGAIVFWEKKLIDQEYFGNEKLAIDIQILKRMEGPLPEICPAVEDNKDYYKVTPELLCYEELYGLWQCVGRIMENMKACSGGNLFYKKSPVNEFTEKLHKRLHKDYIKRLKKRYDGENLWIAFKKGQSRLMAMGIVNPDKKQFVKFYSQTITGTGAEQAVEVVNEATELYNELFADRGMCEAFGFSAYGYFMYSIHIFMKHRNIPDKKGKGATHDRIKLLLVAWFGKEIGLDEEGRINNIEKSPFYEKLDIYWKDLKKSLKDNDSLDICDELKALLDKNCFSDIAERDIRSVLDRKNEFSLLGEKSKYLEILRWATAFYEGMDLENYSVDAKYESLIRHILDSKKENWFTEVSKDCAVQDIRDYYNNYSYSGVRESQKQGRCLMYQNEFIEQNYKQMFNCMHEIRCEMQKPDSRKTILEHLFDYDFEKEDAES